MNNARTEYQLWHVRTMIVFENESHELRMEVWSEKDNPTLPPVLHQG